MRKSRKNIVMITNIYKSIKFWYKLEVGDIKQIKPVDL